MDLRIVEIAPGDVAEFRALRLRGLREHPDAFGEDADAFAACPIEAIEKRIQAQYEAGGFILGARDGAEALVGVVGIRPDTGPKSRHLAMLWGMYVAGEHQRGGIGRRLVVEVIERCRRIERLRSIRLAVETNNTAAQRLYESLGFRAYAIDPKCLFVNGRFLDECLMTLELGTQCGGEK